MPIIHNTLLFVLTFIGGGIPLIMKGFSDKQMQYLLSFSGAFLLCITFLHLLPETFISLGSNAGFYLLVGFFLQLLIQRLTHGAEHGHTHLDDDHHHHHHIPLASILIGLSIHAFMEGIPLGFHYQMKATVPSLYLAVAAHKLPEAMLITSLVLHTKGRARALMVLLVFSLLTPVSAMLSNILTGKYLFTQTISILIPIVAGAFIHIATTIFFESGTKQHMLTWQKIVAMVIGIGAGLLTLVFE